MLKGANTEDGIHIAALEYWPILVFFMAYLARLSALKYITSKGRVTTEKEPERTLTESVTLYILISDYVSIPTFASRK